ncbi:MAG TPA: hypothetical protein VFG23_10405 [Polyangia bacterium]|nr:hypothetical protein [Polyangia bacterium]
MKFTVDRWSAAYGLWKNPTPGDVLPKAWYEDQIIRIRGALRKRTKWRTKQVHLTIRAKAVDADPWSSEYKGCGYVEGVRRGELLATVFLLQHAFSFVVAGLRDGRPSECNLTAELRERGWATVTDFAIKDLTWEDALADAVRQAAVASARQAAGAQLWKWVSVAVTVVTLSIVLTAWSQFNRGERAGFARGSATATKQCESKAAAASWANTPEGQLGYGLARAGSLRDLAACSGRGWIAKDGICFAQPEHGRVHGWRLPSEAALP